MLTSTQSVDGKFSPDNSSFQILLWVRLEDSVTGEDWIKLKE